MILSRWLPLAARRLELAGIESARLEAQLLAAHVFGEDRAWVLTHPETEVPSLAAEALLQRRISREPLAYILGHREFYGRDFQVTPAVLIPRHETDTLVDAALETGPPNARVLDLGAGSGCIGITLKLERPDWRVVASDISVPALEVALQNAEILHASVQLVQAEALRAFANDAFDLIVSNPPYIAQGEELMPEVALHEPKSALFSGPSGLEFYERLSQETSSCLCKGGSMLLEVGHTQAPCVIKIFTDAGWLLSETWLDLSGTTRALAFSCPGGR